MVELGHALAKARDRAALGALREGVAASEQALGAGHVGLIRPWHLLGEALLASDRAAGLGYLERAVTRASAPGASRRDGGRAKTALAHALWATGSALPDQRARAIGLAKDALVDLRAVESPSRELTALEAWLAQRRRSSRASSR
jgi:hypothetical protein